MAASGFAPLFADELVRTHDHGVDPAHVKSMRARATAAWLKSWWNSRAARIAHWLRG